ncbi:MAG: hypothetical protein EKK61_05795 [Rickettsiales bacterium]|nr:MAG: hypothetical protein EKK61_05795 [Rickettsiales bacterium]
MENSSDENLVYNLSQWSDEEKSLLEKLFNINNFNDNPYYYHNEHMEVKAIINKLTLGLDLLNAVRKDEVREDNYSGVETIINECKELSIDISTISYGINFGIDEMKSCPDTSPDIIFFNYSNNKKIYLSIYPTHKFIEVHDILTHKETISTTGNVLCCAIKYSGLNTIKKILDSGVSIDSKLYSYGEACHNVASLAIVINRFDVLKLLVDDYDANVTDLITFDDKSHNPLMCAAYYKSEDMIRYLVEEKEVDINAKNAMQQTALFYAAKSQSLDIIKLFITLGADPKCVDENKNTLLNHFLLDWNTASSNKEESNTIFEIVSYLVHDLKINVNILNSSGKHALFYAVEKNLLRIVQYLIENNAVTECKNSDDETLLMVAAKHTHLGHIAGIGEELISANCNVNEIIRKEDSLTNGYNALTFALESYLPNITFIKLLINSGIKIVLPPHLSLKDFDKDIQLLIIEDIKKDLDQSVSDHLKSDESSDDIIASSSDEELNSNFINMVLLGE